MYRFEVVSILINFLFVLIILAYSDILLVDLSSKTIIAGLWIMTGLFALSTLGNFVSNNKVERMLFTPITLTLTILSLILILA